MLRYSGIDRHGVGRSCRNALAHESDDLVTLEAVPVVETGAKGGNDA